MKNSRKEEDSKAQPGISADKHYATIDKVDEDGEKNGTDQSINCLTLSIEETNKLRKKLGLDPLEVEDKSEKKKEFIHIPAKNIADEELAEKYREKIRLKRERREIEQKARKIKKLYDDDDIEEIDDVTRWVERSRNIQQLQASKKKKKNETQDGISYINVEHDQREFEMGEEAILTLKDADVLQEEDTLENINIIEKRRARENIKNRTKASNYNPYDEYDEITGQLKPAALLSKYDEENSGKNRPTFEIQMQQNKTLNIQITDPFNEQKKGHLRHSLNTDLKLEKDYFIPEHKNFKFKKPKKPKDKSHIKKSYEQDFELENENKPTSNKIESINFQSSIDDDEAALELQSALERIRKAKLKTSHNSQNLLLSIQKIKFNDEKNEQKKGLIIDSVSEFVRIHNSRPLVDEIKNGKDDKDEIKNTSDKELNFSSLEKEVDSKKIFDEEPVILRGVGSALQILSRKGYLENEKKFIAPVETNIPKTIAQIDTEKMRSLHKASRKPDRNESEEYKFDIDVGHYDKKGNLLDPKNAFREISYKFHGKKPTKKKKAKRTDDQGQIKSDIDLAKSLSIMHNKQKKNKTPYLVLTGSNMNILSSESHKKQSK